MTHDDELTPTLNAIRADAVAGRTDWAKYGHVGQRELGPFVILNYTPRAAIEGNWTPGERLCRGLIIDRRTGEVAARAFNRFWNYGENGRTSSAPVVQVHEKMDGSLAILLRTDDGYRVTTRGSFDSEQAQWATAWLRFNHDLTGLDDSLTLLWECIYPGNRIVVDYGERRELVLLAARNRHTGAYVPHSEVVAMAQRYGFGLPRVYDVNDPTELLQLCTSLPANEEGYVATFADGQRFKFKGDAYKALHRLVTRLSFNRVLEAVTAGTVDDMMAAIPDEFLGDARAWLAEIRGERDRIRRLVKAALRTAPSGDRKRLAQYVLGHPDFRDVAAYIFLSVDGGDVDELIFKRAFKDRREAA